MGCKTSSPKKVLIPVAIVYVEANVGRLGLELEGWPSVESE